MKPASVSELQALVQAHDRLHARGKGSKSALHPDAADAASIRLTRLRGITEYQPQEYTLTARAGTPVATIKSALSAKGQYLPFDPLLPDEATIGGTVAANLSGSRRYRYGGVRDFILGAAVVDGLGRAFRVGGKVVKNAAGFDLSKFLVGSLGRYAIMTELTFKVFPDAPDAVALSLRYASLQDALDAVHACNESVHELDMLDFAPDDDGWRLLIGLAGFAESLPQRVDQFLDMLRGKTNLLDAQELADVDAARDPLASLDGAVRCKVALSPRQIPAFDARVTGWRRRYSVGGSVAWLAGDDVDALDADLKDLGLRGLAIEGAVEKPVLGKPLERILADRVKRVLDPQNKFV